MMHMIYFGNHALFWIIWWIESSKQPHLFEIENFCNIIDVFFIYWHYISCLLAEKQYILFNI